jgi:hypothetical protein
MLRYPIRIALHPPVVEVDHKTHQFGSWDQKDSFNIFKNLAQTERTKSTYPLDPDSLRFISL